MADTKELQQAVQDLPDQYLECRMTSHRWKRQGAPSQEGNGLYIIRWRCVECRAERFYRVTSSGVVYSRWYKQPEGYAIKGFGHATRSKAVYYVALIERVSV